MQRSKPLPPTLALAATLALTVPLAAGPGDHAGMSHADCPLAETDVTAPAPVVPTAPGQAAFAALGEIVRMLEADPATDWSTVSIARLREHLRDMDEVTLRAEVVESPIDGGFAAEITGGERTLAAVRRMLPMHAAMLGREKPWTVRVEELPHGVRLTATAADPAETAKLRGLGFFGILVSGDHHRPHHLAMAGGR
ncbi:MAG: hypothetical protein R2991_03075 [Thermoanaerobaculia bacterium]